jgi:hypothetical protein
MVMSKDEGIQLLKSCKEQLGKTPKTADALQVLALAGKSVGYAPTMRALVMGVEPEKAIKWT